MRQEKRPAPHLSRVLLTVLALTAVCAVCLTAASCSDQILNPDGTVSTVGQEKQTHSLTLEDNGETDREPSPGTGTDTADVGTVSIDLETQAPVISIGDDVPFEGQSGILRIDFLPVGKGDCTLILTDSKTVLIDTGESDDWGTLSGALREHQVDAIDILILTHFDNDHIGTASTLLDKYTVHEVYLPDYTRNSKIYRKLSQALDKLPDGSVKRMFGEGIDLAFDGVTIRIDPTAMPDYAPGQTVGTDQENEFNSENNFSLMTTLTFADVRMLFAGDAERERLEEYLASPTYTDCPRFNLIKIPHHGVDCNRALINLLKDSAPRYCVISCGTDDNSKTAAELVTCMRSIMAGQYYTYNGTLHVYTDGQKLELRQTP